MLPVQYRWCRLCYAFFAVLLWVYPLIIIGSKQLKMPSYLVRWPLYDCAALFTHRSNVWGDPAIVLRLDDGSWIEPKMELFSPQGLAGYRQRLERIVREIPKSRGKIDLGGKVATFVAKRYFEQTGQDVVEVRVVNTTWPAGVPEMVRPAGQWDWPPLAQVSKKRQREWYHGRLVDGRWVGEKAPARLPPSTGMVGDGMTPSASKRPKRMIRLPMPPTPGRTAN